MPGHHNNDVLTTCSQCSERFAATARFCSHCGADNLGGDGDQEVDVAFNAKLHYDLFLLGIPVASTLALWLWVGNENLAQSPLHSLLLVGLLNVIGTAATACLEARAFGSHRRGPHHFDPPIWFALIALLWIPAYPLYLFRRKDSGAPNLLAAGIILTLIFSGSVAAVGYRIGERQQALQHLLTSDPNTESTMRQPQDTGIDDAIAAYQQARKFNSPIEICIKAKQVVALLREANDLERYRPWDATQKADCHAAGLLEQ